MTIRTDREVAAARRELRALLTRRDFVAASAVAGVGLLGLAGCSSSDSSGTVTPPPPPPPPSGLGQVSGTVSLPSGSGLAVNTLAVKVMGQSVALTTAATFAAGVSPNAPTMAMVTDANGNGVLAGFLDSTLSGAQPITPRSTGVVLTWFALGGPFVPANLKSQLLALLTADPAMDTFGQVIAQRIAATPLAIVNADTQVAAALSTALEALGASSVRAIGAAQMAQDDAPKLTVSPAADQSGVSVTSDNTIVGVDISNAYRRPVRAYVYETQTDTGGTLTDVSPAKRVAGPFDVGEPTAVTIGGGLQSFLAAQAPFQPFTINPIPLTLDGASDDTTYEVVVIGPSTSGVVPDFFGAPRYANEVAGWNSAIGDLFARTYYCDLVYALLLEITGFASILPTSPHLVEAGVNTQKISGNPFTSNSGPPLPSSPNSLAGGVSALLTELNSSGSSTAQYQSLVPTIMDQVDALALQAVNTIDWQASLKTGTDFLLKISSPFSNYQANGALGKLLGNLANADPGVLWTALVAKAQVTITPADAVIPSGDMIALTAVLSADLTSTYEFNWSSSSSTATFSAVGESNIGATINTSQKTVNLMTTSADTVPIVVTLVVYDLANGQRAFLTRVSTTVSVVRRATISPASAVLSVGDQKTFAVTVVGSLPADVQYLWSLVGGAGSIGAPNVVVTTTVPQITYTAEQKGNDTLSVQVFGSGNQLLAKGSAVINVDPDAFIKFSILGTWPEGFQNGDYLFGDTVGYRVNSAAPGRDIILFESDRIASGDAVTSGALISLILPSGTEPTTGEVFPKVPVGTIAAPGEFQLSLTLDFNDVANGGTLAPQAPGTLQIDSLDIVDTGNYVVSYSFTIANDQGGTISGNGVGHWTE